MRQRGLDPSFLCPIMNISEQLSFSTSEIACGKWTNGKTIYRKTFTNIQNGTTNLNLTGMSEVLKIEAIGSDGGNKYSIPYTHSDGSLWASIYISSAGYATLTRKNLQASAVILTVYYIK